MSFKRMWRRAVRSRGHLKPVVAMTCTILLSTLLLDSVFISRKQDSPEDPRKIVPVYDDHSVSTPSQGHASNLTHLSNLPPPSPTPSSSQSSSSYELPDKQEALEGKNVATYDASGAYGVEIVKNSFFEEDKGRVVHKISPDVSEFRKNGQRKAKGGEKKITRSETYHRDPSFGFVNKNFEPPPPPSPRTSVFMNLVQRFVGREEVWGINPGSILGAVAALRQLKSSDGQAGNDDSPMKTIMKVAGLVGQVMSPSKTKGETGDSDKKETEGKKLTPDTQDSLKSELKGSSNEMKENKLSGTELIPPKSVEKGENVSLNSTHHLRPAAHSNPSQRSGEEGRKKVRASSRAGRGSSGGQGSPAGGLGSLLTQLGPSLLAGALENKQQRAGSHSNPLQTLIGGVGSSLLAGFANQGPASKNEPYSKRALDSMSLGALVSEVGPGFLAGAVQKGLGVVGNGDSSHPLQSVLGGVGSALMQSLTNGHSNDDGGKSSSSVQSLVSGLAPVLLAEVMGQGLNAGTRQDSGGMQQNGSKQSPLQLIAQSLGPLVLKGALSRGFGGGGAGGGGGGGRVGGGGGRVGGERVGGDRIGGGGGGKIGGGGERVEVGVVEGERLKRGEQVRIADTGKTEHTYNDKEESDRGIGRGNIPKTLRESSSPRDGDKSGPGRDKRARKRKHLVLPAELPRTRGSRALQGRETDLDTEDVIVHNPTDITNDLSFNVQSFYKDEGRGSDDVPGRRRTNDMAGSWADDETGSGTDNDVAGGGAKGAAVRLAMRVLLSQLLPEELPLPEVNSTKGVWEMAVNFVLGNPRNNGGGRSQFWKWLRDIGGEERDEEEEEEEEADDTEEREPRREETEREENDILEESSSHPIENEERPEQGKSQRELRPSDGENDDHNDDRTKTTTAGHQTRRESPLVARVYSLVEASQEHLCRNSRLLGGVYTWKTGKLEGSGTVCADPDVLPKSPDCLVYSFGLTPQWSFEEDMEKLGCQVYVFDPRATTGNHDHSPGVHFFNLGVAEANTTRRVDAQVWNLFTLSAIMDRLGHTTSPLHYLRMDVAGREWKVLQEALVHTPHHLTNIHQLGVRIHLDKALRDPILYENYLEVLLGLQGLGFQLFSSRASQERRWGYYDATLGRRVSLRYDLVFLRI